MLSWNHENRMDILQSVSADQKARHSRHAGLSSLVTAAHSRSGYSGNTGLHQPESLTVIG